ncbi:D-2-hydroxyacid dehydrogenase [Lacticaseibacillus nasuensis]|uniref:2-hydroxyacid dehydrogenase n=1 Tax=Lacticaseibacillus nasuensis TaxID=944671 RepID=UPI00224800BE|nr:NAD(P)-dependent oxidoreductase [Lacticaseibacillus nasuensis]MCX2456114.1 D-2-hydroxyacid dehydrogenase [Lacticaseibacillus nasuensis]
MSKVVILNAGAINYDGQLDFTSIADNVVTYNQTAPEQLGERTTGATIVVTKELPMTAESIAQLPESVQMCVEAGTGYNNYDLAALASRGIALTNIPAYSTARVADTAIMLMLSLASSLQQQVRMLAAGNHDNFTKHLMVPHVELNGKTLGVIGYGHIGQAVIQRALAMEMQILVATRTPRADLPGVHFTTQADLLQHSDVVSLHLPLTPATHHLIDEAALAQMKPSAFLINTARGGLVDTAALIAALTAGTLAGAGLDVQEPEPLPADSPLYTMDSVVLTPHIGWRGLETRQRLVRLIGDNVQAWLAGAPINRVH